MSDNTYTAVVSDIHGNPELFLNAMTHMQRSGITPNRVIFAGDFLDIGRQPDGCLELIEEYADTKLFGNHETAIIAELDIYPQDRASWGFRDYLLQSVGNGWDMVAFDGDYLISHAGVSVLYRQQFDELGMEDFVSSINEDFVRDVGRYQEAGTFSLIGGHSLLSTNEFNPLWHRPYIYGRDALSLLPVPQVIGHTPPNYFPESVQRLLRKKRIHLSDPYARGVFRNSARNWYRYVLITNGTEAKRLEGFLQR